MSERLSEKQIEQFITDGFIRIDHAFSAETAEAAREILWDDLSCEKSDPATWTEPVIRLGMYSHQPFIDSVNSSNLHSIFDQLIGEGKWLPCMSVGTFPVRFPSGTEAGDTGKHVDASFPGEDPSDYMEWRVNVKSKGRALLMLVLYSDVTELDAPTVVYKGSHRDVARLLRNEGEKGLAFMALAERLESLPRREEALATGKAGSIYLCHPFLVHAAQDHHGSTPKFMAQPPLRLRTELRISGSETGYSPVEKAIWRALSE
jgi:hypothetical protein